jgi:hypothetical protein
VIKCSGAPWDRSGEIGERRKKGWGSMKEQTPKRIARTDLYTRVRLTTQWKIDQSPLFDSTKRPFPRKARETVRTKREFWFESRNSETDRRAKIPVFAGLMGHRGAKNRETGLVGWRASADRTSLRPQFPANREFYREIRKVFGFAGTARANFQQIIRLF